MIVGIGVDLVSIERIERLLQRFGDAFAKKVLSDAELTEFEKQKHPARFLAKCFAAKEAAVKALGQGFRKGMTLHDISVNYDEQGKPNLDWLGAAKQQFVQKANQAHLSISDETDTAIAYVILEY
jgi:holo-[acyl-carrier protein] synthase